MAQGISLAYFYTAKPISLKYYALGEKLRDLNPVGTDEQDRQPN